MPDQLQLRGGTTVQHSTFTGASKEVTVDTTKKTAVVHDGSTVGGNPLMREDASNSALALGSAAAPSLKFTGDTNTGIYSPGADQVAVATNGVGRLFVDASGNIDLKGATNQNSTLRLYPNGTAVYAGAQFFNSAGSQGAQLLVASGSEVYLDSGGNGSINYRASGTGTHVWFTNGAQKATIDSSGRLGIGTSDPSTILTIQKNIDSSAYGSGTQVIDFKTPYPGFDVGTIKSSIYSGVSSQVPLATNKGYLAFLTHNGTSLTEKLRIESNGSVGIGTTTVDALLEVYSPTNGANLAKFSDAFNNRCLIVKGASGGVNLIAAEETNEASTGYGIAFSRGATEMGRFDGSGRLLVGTSTSRAVAGQVQPIQNEGTVATGVSCIRNSNDAISGFLLFGKSRGATTGTSTAVIANDALGGIVFAGADGTDINTQAAGIYAEVDGTPGPNDMPGRLVFSTTSDSASSPTERLRITSTGQVRLAGAGITFNGDTAAANELDDYEEGTWTVSFFDAVTGGNASATTDTGYYTKIGDRVICNFTTSNIDTTGMTGANNLFFTLPFTSSASKGVHFGSCALENINANDASITIAASVNASVARGYLLGSVDNAGFSAIIVSNLTSTAADVWVSITYAA
jgi:hypothetical protein